MMTRLYCLYCAVLSERMQLQEELASLLDRGMLARYVNGKDRMVAVCTGRVWCCRLYGTVLAYGALACAARGECPTPCSCYGYLSPIVLCYRAMRCPVHKSVSCYAMSGSNVSLSCYAVSGTDIGIVLCVLRYWNLCRVQAICGRYAMSGTAQGCDIMR
eukprot:744282-Rhodomonas_salina.2